ncbi:MAG: glucosamine-6-phosphate deaminase [Lentisphaerae bacterium]|jgi:glucosamine-6-phosphate deaminase|nr:glucosamine-6-phosphate deaminase [Victivallaceae bacterium]MDD3704090.1 glucosamine-6-phosphate deaminase [Victivallaceae bacterium]MDD5664093.1 glucosamine-6-phosphate deaminase [Victivallaceae bacterium]NLK84063.1 glucosamine-6-phosphate deaminase [Lentisphaerota bacterium]
MTVQIYSTVEKMGAAAAAYGAEKIRKAIAERGSANIIIATGASQFSMLCELIKAPGIEWGKVTMFHLDEYVGIPESHPASFRKYIKERFVANLPAPLKAAYFVDGSNPDPQKVCDELGEIIAQNPIDACFIGIGENGHIAFNDPPADFDTEKAYLVVDLDEACRKQQLGEGWFPTINDVPKQAISMSPRQILKSKAIINTVPDARKADAVKITIEGELCPEHPASVIRFHADCVTFLDTASAAKLSKITKDFCTR